MGRKLGGGEGRGSVSAKYYSVHDWPFLFEVNKSPGTHKLADSLFTVQHSSVWCDIFFRVAY